MKHPLEEIPGVGPRIARSLIWWEKTRRNCTDGSAGSKDLRKIAAPCMSGGRRSIMPRTRCGKQKN